VSGSTRAREVRGYFAHRAIHAGHAWGASRLIQTTPAMEIKSATSTARRMSLNSPIGIPPPDVLTDGAGNRAGTGPSEPQPRGDKAAAPTRRADVSGSGATNGPRGLTVQVGNLNRPWQQTDRRCGAEVIGSRISSQETSARTLGFAEVGVPGERNRA
jgi:hypothetical protein